MYKIMFLSHGHPDLSKGGAEVASWNLFSKFKQMGHECLYIARTDSRAHQGSSFSVRNDDEVLFHTAMSNSFLHSSSRVGQLFDDLAALTQSFDPDIIHMHHYAHIGVEAFRALRQAAPNAKIIFTLHEFLAICAHNGQMVKTDSLKLCYKASSSDCSACFPQRSPADFHFRKQYFLDQFSYVDHFVSPSQFLADRYIDWGLDADKISVIENVLPPTASIPPRVLPEGGKRGRFAFFGQLNQYKGIDVLLEAFLSLSDEVRANTTLEIHGANLEKQSAEFQQRVQPLLQALEGHVIMRGPYESVQLPALMADCDWVIIPSIWWENSPVVIQEAIAHGRPLIGSNIGGMKEKIENTSGLVFEARSASSLANKIMEAMEPECFDGWQQRLESKSLDMEEHYLLMEKLSPSAEIQSFVDTEKDSARTEVA